MRFSKLSTQVLAALGIIAAGVAMSPAAAAATLNPSDSSVQLFKWSWSDIATECTQWLGPQGYGGVQISPPSAAMSNGNWWDMYQPTNYGSLTSRMGTATDLQNMINTCHAAGVRIYADIVVNQMANGSGNATDGSSWNAGSLQYPQFSSSDFHPFCSIASTDYNNNTYNVQHCWLVGLPDLATEGSHVQSVIASYMETLVGMGVDGFRMDAAKHQQEDQLALIFNAVKAKYPTTLQGEPLFVTQEIIPDGEVNRVSYEALGTLNEFQFVYAMQAAFRNINGLTPATIPTAMGTPGAWGGSWSFLTNSNAVQIFVDDWDTERNNGGSLTASDFSGNTNDASGTYRYDLANMFMLAQPYGIMAQVQSGFRFTGGDQDRPSTSAFSNGVAQVPSSRTQNSGWDFIHRWPQISNMVKFRSATRGQGMSNWVTGTANQIAFSRGAIGFVALNNDTVAWTNTFQTGLPAGTYCNIAHGTLNAAGTACTSDSITVNSSGNATLSIVANGGSVVPAVAIYTAQKVGTVTDTTPPSVPAGLTFGSATATSITFSWAASTDNTGGSGVASYIVFRNGAKVGTSTGTSYTDTGLTNSTTYSYTVEAVDNAGNISAASTALSAATTIVDGTPPTAPGTPTATSISASSVTLSWAAATDNVGVVRYDIYRNGTLVGSSTTTTYTDSTVAASTAYTYTIKAADAVNNISVASGALSVTTTAGNVATVYYQPSTSWTTVDIHYGINGTWTVSPGVAMSVACTGWDVKTINLGTYTSLQVTFNNGSGTWDNNGGNNYTLGVGISSVSGGKITTGTSPCTADTTPPTTPTNVTSSSVTQTGLVLSWTASTDNVGVAGYYVYRGGVKVGTVTSGTSYTDSGLTAGTAYSYTVSAYDAAGNVSTTSSPVYTVSTLAADTTAPSVPASLVASSVTSTSLTLSWTASTDNTGGSGMAGYQVFRNGTLVGSPTAATYADSGLTAGTSYSYTVKAKDVAGNLSAASTALAVTTSTSTGCAVTFTIANANTVTGQNLYVSGNQTVLGNWTPASSFALTIVGSGANVPWTGTKTLPASTAIQYKYIKYNASTGAVTWEANQSTTSGNREYTTCASGSAARNDGNF